MHTLLLPLLLGAGVTIEDEAVPGKAMFAAPVQLTSSEGPIGHGLLYPSPAMFDLDGDGTKELIVADLFGKVQFAKRAPGSDTQWTPLTPVKTRDDAPLKFSNW